MKQYYYFDNTKELCDYVTKLRNKRLHGIGKKLKRNPLKTDLMLQWTGMSPTKKETERFLTGPQQ